MMQTLPQILETAAQQDSVGIHYLQKDGTTVFESYHDLLQQAQVILGGLQKQGAQAGDTIILALSDNQEVIPTFWACLLGGLTPTLLPAPISLYYANKSLDKLQSVWELFEEPTVVLSQEVLAHQMDKVQVTPIPNDKLQTVASIKLDSKKPQIHESKPEDIAFVQFSSGTTGHPKGVILTHKNVCQNLQSLSHYFDSLTTEYPQQYKEGASLSWLPLYHDMGLVGFHLEPMYFQRSQYQMNTLDFIKQPHLWLDSLEKYHIGATAAPNFSQKLVMDYLKKHPEKKWDFSNLKIIYNGAEPISVDLMLEFSAKLQSFGLEPNAMTPVYGLAEATLAVSCPPLEKKAQFVSLDRNELQQNRQAVIKGDNQPDTIRFVNVGGAVPGCDLRIVDELDQELSESTVGHIQVKGGNVAQGYYKEPQLTKKAFCDEWLRTGDMGFLKGGELYVTGRAKDVIFVNGQNYYAEDLEETAQWILGDQLAKIAICGSFDEDLKRDRVLVFLGGDDPTQLVRRFLEVKRELMHKTRLQVDTLVPLTQKQFPKTSSGKLQRYRLRDQYEQGRFDMSIEKIAELIAQEEAGGLDGKVSPRSTTETMIHQICCEELGLDPEELGIHDAFIDLGVSSVRAAQILIILEKRYHINLQLSLFNQYQTISELAQYVDTHPMITRRKHQIFKG